MRFSGVFSLLLFVSICFSASSQSGRTANYSISWSEVSRGNAIRTPEFEQGVERSWAWDLPCVLHNFSLGARSRSIQPEITALSVEPVPAEIFTQDQIRNLGEDFQWQATVKKGRDKNYGIVEILPFRKRSGTVERLLSYELAYSEAETSDGRQRTATFADHSVLAEGTWYKIATDRDGIYRIDANVMRSLGVEPSDLVPDAVNVYGNGGAMLPFKNSEFRYDDLVATPIYGVGMDDGSFDSNDYFLFYASGADSWNLLSEAEPGSLEPERFVHQRHAYADSAYYFIRIDDTQTVRVQTEASSQLSVTHTATSFQDRFFVENELVNLVKSGREFFGERLSASSPLFAYNFSVPDILQVPAHLKVALASRTIGPVSSSFTLNADGSSAEITNILNTTGSTTANVANLGSRVLTFTPNDAVVNASVTFNPGNADAEAWIDFLQLNCTRLLRMSGSYLQFRDTASVGEGNITGFVVANGNLVSEVWDVSRPESVKRIAFETEANEARFTLPTNELRELVAFNISGVRTPRTVGFVPNQDLHAWNGADMVIVSQPGLVSAAQELADYHTSLGTTTLVATPQQVFNEFSSGNRDVTAIKMLMKMLYDRAGGDPESAPRHLLLFGDGSYNNRSFIGSTSNYIITYQSLNSVSPTSSYVSDDYFAFLDDNEGEDITDKLDIGVGRIPVSNLSDARSVVRKIKNYSAPNSSFNADDHCGDAATGSPYGSWRNIIAFVSDDQDGNDIDGNVHMRHSDEHADSVFLKYNDYNIEKIYMDAYTQLSTPGGERYPEAEEAIRRRVQNGALIVNYIGHGGERGWAHERVLDIPTIRDWSNLNRLPLFMTATCELSRYDDPAFESAGEIMLLNPEGGGIALLTTTRIVFSGSNQRLGRAFYYSALEDDAYTRLDLGDVARLTKNDTISLTASSNMRNFSLLGDPALRLSYPKEQVYTTLINGQSIEAQDTIKALQEVTITGYVGDMVGNKLQGFNGFVFPTVYDKRNTIVCQNNDNVSEYDFEVYRSIIYKGKASVVDGDFSFSFVVPRDIAYAFGEGRISYYAVQGEGSVDAHGYSQEFVIGGSLSGAELNAVGPEIELFLNDDNFVSGGLTGSDPVIFARIFDDNGVNTVGNGIGHDITAVLDGNTDNTIILNDYYESDLDTYKSGQVRYQLNNLSEGNHTLEFKVWDVHNNSSKTSIDFIVASEEDLALEHVLNYPNPFTTHTDFYFEHNQACSALDVRIQVFTVSGKLVKTIDRIVSTDGFRSEPIAWNGTDDFGDPIGRGVYVYMVEVRTPDGKTAEAFEKLVILR